MPGTGGLTMLAAWYEVDGLMQRLLLALVLVPLLIAPLLAAGSALSIARLDVQLSDLPPGSALLRSNVLTAAQLAKESNHPGFTLLHKGFIVEHDGEFAIGSAGPLRVTTSLQQFASPAQAHAAYLSSLPPDLGGLGPQIRRLGGNEGDERIAEEMIQPMDMSSLTIALFRRGCFVEDVLILGKSDTFPPGQAVRLAKIVDGRMQLGKHP